MTAYVWAVLAAMVWGIAPLMEKVGLRNVTPMTGLFFRSLGVGIGIVVLGVFAVKPAELRSADPRAILLLMGAGFTASIIGQTFFYNSLKLGEVSRLVPISGSYPLFAFLFGVLLMGESFSLLKVGGMFLVLLGVWLLRIG